jgi:hypothetical protein
MFKKTLKFMLAVILLFSLTATAFANEPPTRKVQIDWLIYAAGGTDIEGRNGAEPDESVTGEFSYEFTSEDGTVQGMVTGSDGEIRIYTLNDTGEEYTEPADDCTALELARHFTQHFATLTRRGHFHASHRLSARATEEYPIYYGATQIMTFCYATTDNGGMMCAVEFQHTVKLVFNFRNYIPATLLNEVEGAYHAVYDNIPAETQEPEPCEDLEPEVTTVTEATTVTTAPETPAETATVLSELTESPANSGVLPIVIIAGAVVGIVVVIIIISKKGHG